MCCFIKRSFFVEPHPYSKERIYFLLKNNMQQQLLHFLPKNFVIRLCILVFLVGFTLLFFSNTTSPSPLSNESLICDPKGLTFQDVALISQTDKESDSHHYSAAYNKYIQHLRCKRIKFLEIGLGCGYGPYGGKYISTRFKEFCF